MQSTSSNTLTCSSDSRSPSCRNRSVTRLSVETRFADEPPATASSSSEMMEWAACCTLVSLLSLLASLHRSSQRQPYACVKKGTPWKHITKRTLNVRLRLRGQFEQRNEAVTIAGRHLRCPRRVQK